MAESTLGILVFPGVEELDFVGPWELFGLWHEYANGPRCRSVGAGEGVVRARHGLRVVPDLGLAEAPPLEYLLVPGGPGAKRVAHDSTVPRYVARQAETAHAVLSVCTGVRVLHAAGLLDGRHGTTHHSLLEEMRDWGGVTAVEQRYVQDGGLWTAAGVSAGLDMALAFIAEEAGEAVAARVQDEAEYFPEGRRYRGETDA